MPCLTKSEEIANLLKIICIKPFCRTIFIERKTSCREWIAETSAHAEKPALGAVTLYYLPKGHSTMRFFTLLETGFSRDVPVMAGLTEKKGRHTGRPFSHIYLRV